MRAGKNCNDFRAIRLMLCAGMIGKALLAQVPAKVDFARDIQPLLQEHCIECHGPSQQMRGLRLDRRRDALPNRVGANGARIVPGNSARQCSLSPGQRDSRPACICLPRGPCSRSRSASEELDRPGR